MFLISQSVCPCQAFPAQPNVSGKAGAYPSEAPSNCSTLRQTSGLTHKHQTRLESPDMDKHQIIWRFLTFFSSKGSSLKRNFPLVFLHVCVKLGPFLKYFVSQTNVVLPSICRFTHKDNIKTLNRVQCFKTFYARFEYS